MNDNGNPKPAVDSFPTLRAAPNAGTHVPGAGGGDPGGSGVNANDCLLGRTGGALGIAASLGQSCVVFLKRADTTDTMVLSPL